MYKLNIQVTGSEHVELSSQSVVQVCLTKKAKECMKIKPSLDRRTKKLQWKDGIQIECSPRDELRISVTDGKKFIGQDHVKVGLIPNGEVLNINLMPKQLRADIPKLSLLITFELPTRERSATLPILPSTTKEDQRAELKRSRTPEGTPIKKQNNNVKGIIDDVHEDYELDDSRSDDDSDSDQDNRENLMNPKLTDNNNTSVNNIDMKVHEDLEPNEIIDTGAVAFGADPETVQKERIDFQANNNTNTAEHTLKLSSDWVISEDKLNAVREVLMTSDNSRESLKNSLEAAGFSNTNHKDPLKIAQLILEKQSEGIRTSGDDVLIRYSVSSGLIVHLVLDMTKLPDEYASGCGITKSKKIVAKISFPTGEYMSDIPSRDAHTLEIRCSGSTNFNTDKVADWTVFGLWWTLERRITKILREIYPKMQKRYKTLYSNINAAMVSTSDKVKELVEILELTPLQIDLVELALQKSNDDEKEAIRMLLDETSRHQLEAERTKEYDILHDKHFKKCNLLKKIQRLIIKGIFHSGKYCPICDVPRSLNYAKPNACRKSLCRTMFNHLGLGAILETEILHSPRVLDFLISITYTAADNKMLRPFPSEVRAIDAYGRRVRFHKSKPEEILQLLSKVPRMSVLQTYVKEGRLKKELDAIHPLTYLFLRWIMNCSEAHIYEKQYEENEHINSKVEDPSSAPPAPAAPLTDEQQYANQHNGMVASEPSKILLFGVHCTPPKKERLFQMYARSSAGTFFAYHGSRLNNWHSIIRNGLKNMSYTFNAVNGASYGPGIYLAGEPQTSLGYATNHTAVKTWPQSMFGTNTHLWKVVAVCEVVQPKGNLTMCLGQVHNPGCWHSTSSPYFRVVNNDMIVTRYLIFNFSTRYDNFTYNNWQRGVIKPIRSRHYLSEWLKDDDSEEEKRHSGTINNQ